MQFNVRIEINSLNVICSLRSQVRSIVSSVRMYVCLFIESLEKLIMLALFKSVMELNGKLILLTLHGRKMFSRTLLLYLHCIIIVAIGNYYLGIQFCRYSCCIVAVPMLFVLLLNVFRIIVSCLWYPYLMCEKMLCF